jgi:MFS family permease
MALPLFSHRHSSSSATPLHALYTLKNRNFAILWTGAFLSNIGFWIQTVGQGWQVLQLTNSALLLGLVTFAATLPNIVLSLFGGIIADRMNRRYLLIITQTVYMMTAGLLGVLTTLHIITVWQIILLALVNGVFSSVGFPAWQTFIGDLVPPGELRQGIALNSMQFNLSRVIGPAIGGLSVGIFGIAGSYYLNALSFVAVIVPLCFIHPRVYQRSKNNAQERHGVLSSLRDGFNYVRVRPVLQIVLFLQFLIAFFVLPYATLLPIFAGNIFRIGAAGLGVLNAAAGVGALLGSILVVLLSEHMESKHSRNILTWVCLVGGSASIVFAAVINLNMALLLLLVMGGCCVMAATITNTTLQTQTPQEMRGRVLSIWVLITFGLAPFGNLVAGWVAQAFGAPFTLGLGGTICLFGVMVLLVTQIRTTLPLAFAKRR